nr:MAG TPA: hypothetical protein [Caudoviricetes sp.]
MNSLFVCCLHKLYYLRQTILNAVVIKNFEIFLSHSI